MEVYRAKKTKGSTFTGRTLFYFVTKKPIIINPFKPNKKPAGYT
jgi:hypothetical protein